MKTAQWQIPGLGTHKSEVLRIAILVILTALVYFNSLGNGFVWDDSVIILKNPLLTGVSNLPDLLISEDTFPGVKSGYYRPLTYLSFFIDRSLWGLNPLGFHITNLLLHIGVVISFSVLISMIFKNSVLGFLSALFFALHPVNAETINFLSGGRNTLLSALFMLVAFILYIKQRRLLSVLFFCLSILSKEFGLLLPVLLLIYDGLINPDRPHRKTEPVKGMARYGPYGICIIIYLAVRSFIVGGTGFDFSYEDPVSRLLLVPQLVLQYIKTMAAPLWIKVPYLLIPPKGIDGSVLVSAAGCAALITGVYLLRRSKIVLVASLWFLLFFIPVSNIIPLGYIVMADRYAYFMSMGFALLASGLILRLKRPYGHTMIIVLCLLFSIVVISRNPVWKDEYSLYRAMVSDSPSSAIAHHNMGMYLYDSGDEETGIGHLEKAVQGQPKMADTFAALGLIYWETGRLDEALPLLERAVALNPGDFRSMIIISKIYEEQGDAKEAAAVMEHALALYPQAEKVLRDRAVQFCLAAEGLQSEGKLAPAERYFTKALRYHPSYARALIGLGSIVAERGALDRAIEYFKEASVYEPSNPLPHYNLSLAYRLKGMTESSEEEMRIVRELGGLPPQHQ
jgi:Flp pilus assembly protein TadD